MDWVNDLSTKLKHPFVFSNDGFEPIVIKNPSVQFRWRTVFITGEIAFSTFENIVDDELFNFDIDFVRPLQDGSMMLVGKPVQIKLALEHSIVYQNFDLKMRQADFEETLQLLLSNSESAFLQQYHWMVLSLSQNHQKKQIGHETVWNLIDYDDANLMENWDDLVGQASLHFVQQQGIIDDFMNEIDDNDFSSDELSQIFNQAKDQLMDKDNPMGNVLSKMFDNDEDFQSAISESMNHMMDMFGGVEDIEEEEYEEQLYETPNEVILDHLEMLETKFEIVDDGFYKLIHKSEVTGQPYNCSIISSEDYIHVITTYNQTVPRTKSGEIYRLINGLNACIQVGKLLIDENAKLITLRTELPTPCLSIPEEPITDIIDENWVYANDTFYILDQYFDGKMTYEQAIEEAKDSFSF